MWSAWSLSSRCFPNSRRHTSSSSGTQTTDSSSRSRAGSVRRSLVVAVAAGTAFASLALIGLSSATVASAATSGAPAVAQCNPPDFPITAGFQVTCTVAVVNTKNSSGATSSTVTTSACLAAAGVPFPSCPLNFGANHQHYVLDPTRDFGEPVQRHRDGRGKQRVLQRHSHQQRSRRNVDCGGHGRSVHRIGRRRRQHRNLRPHRQYDQCHCHSVQRFRDRRRHLPRGNDGGLHRHGWHVGVARDHQPV